MSRKATAQSNRGFFGIGVENIKTKHNLGTLWRSAQAFGASFLFTVGRRYQRQGSDTTKAYREIPLFHFQTVEALVEHLPYDCPLVGVELDSQAKPLPEAGHRERLCYLLGAEDYGLSKDALWWCHHFIQIPADYVLNVAVAGSIVMYDRMVKRHVHEELSHFDGVSGNGLAESASGDTTRGHPYQDSISEEVTVAEAA